MDCNLENLSFTDKIKYLQEKFESGVFSYDPSQWDKNLSTDDDTLQKIFDKVDDLELGTIQDQPESTTANISLDTIQNLKDYNEVVSSIKVLGYYKKDDTVLPVFRYTQITDRTIDNATVIPHASGVGFWEMEYAGVVKAEYFGALPISKGRFFGSNLDLTSLQNKPNPKKEDWAFVGDGDVYVYDGTNWNQITDFPDYAPNLQNALDNHDTIQLPTGLIPIKDRLTIRRDGVKFVGYGTRNTFLYNRFTNSRFIDVGDIYQTDGYCKQGEIGSFSIVGHSGSEDGITVWGSDAIRILQETENGDANVATWGSSSTGWEIHDIGVQTLGNGTGLRVFTWTNHVKRYRCFKYPGEVTTTKHGLEIGFEHNACHYENIELTYLGDTALVSTADGAHGVITASTFKNLIIQNSPREQNKIQLPIRGWWDCSIDGLYMELQDYRDMLSDDTVVGEPIIYIDNRSYGVQLKNIFVLGKNNAPYKAFLVNDAQYCEIDTFRCRTDIADTMIINSKYDVANKTYLTPSTDVKLLVKGHQKTDAQINNFFEANHREMMILGTDDILLENYRTDGSNKVELKSFRPVVRYNDIASENNIIDTYSDGGKFVVEQLATGEKLLEIDANTSAHTVPTRHVIANVGDTHSVNFGKSNLIKITPTSVGTLTAIIPDRSVGQSGAIIIYDSENITDYSGYHFANGVKPKLSGKSMLEYVIQTTSVVLITNITTNLNGASGALQDISQKIPDWYLANTITINQEDLEIPIDSNKTKVEIVLELASGQNAYYPYVGCYKNNTAIGFDFMIVGDYNSGTTHYDYSRVALNTTNVQSIGQSTAEHIKATAEITVVSGKANISVEYWGIKNDTLNKSSTSIYTVDIDTLKFVTYNRFNGIARIYKK